jgi:DNA-binding NarL/FixJ family response regulator
MYLYLAGCYWIGKRRVLLPRAIAGLVRKNSGRTPHEIDVIAAIVACYTNQDVAKGLDQKQTVKHHLTNIF